MDEYIKRKTILELIESGAMWSRNFEELYECVKYMQAEDVVPVVRCGQCKFNNLCCRNIGKDGKRTKDDFCSYGVKKE